MRASRIVHSRVSGHVEQTLMKFLSWRSWLYDIRRWQILSKSMREIASFNSTKKHLEGLARGLVEVEIRYRVEEGTKCTPITIWTKIYANCGRRGANAAVRQFRKLFALLVFEWKFMRITSAANAEVTARARNSPRSNCLPRRVAPRRTKTSRSISYRVDSCSALSMTLLHSTFHLHSFLLLQPFLVLLIIS